jgi:preprotein translocase subunit SecD
MAIAEHKAISCFRNIIMNTIFLFMLCLFASPQKVKHNAKLSTGWYYINEDNSGVKRQLDKTNTFYFMGSTPIITSKNINKIEFRRDNQGKDYLAMQFDNAGTQAWSFATARSTGKRLGFILNDKLIQAPYVNSQITGGIAAIWDYSKAELELIKNEILKK